LKCHLYNKFRIGQNDTSTCGTSRMTGTHILQCPIYEEQRRQIWPVPERNRHDTNISRGRENALEMDWPCSANAGTFSDWNNL
jgi:hypothetical protein